MLQEKAGAVAGEIWQALNEKGGQDFKSLKKTTKEKDDALYLGLGWLLREDKIYGDKGIFNLK